MDNKGFTLVELMVVAAILVVISGLGMVALRSSGTAMATAEAKGDAQRNVRNLMSALTRELQLASKKTDDSLEPPLLPLAITQNPADASPIEVRFQVPTQGTGRDWSEPIIFRYINEDINGNGQLDTSEDLDGDGVLSRRIVRMQDRNGDGDTLDDGESAPVGGANDLAQYDPATGQWGDGVAFTLNNDVLTITVTASRLVGVRRTNPVTATATSSIYLIN